MTDLVLRSCESLLLSIVERSTVSNTNIYVLNPVYGQRQRYALMNPYFYDGYAGLIYALFNYSTIFSSDYINSIIRKALNTLYETLDDRNVILGFYDGIAGVLFVLLELKDVFKLKFVDQAITRLTNMLIEGVDMSIGPDFISGAAGILYNFLSKFPDHFPETFYCRLMQIISSSVTINPVDCYWKRPNAQSGDTGLAHGNIGILLAMSRYYAMIEKSEWYDEILRKGLHFCDSRMNEDRTNWLDLRHVNRSCSFAWCHGSPGILLGLSKMDFDLKQSKYSKAFNFFRHHAARHHSSCLCHGLTGNLMVYNAIVTSPSVEEFDFGLMSLFSNQNSGGSSDHIPQQGYMQGESGIADQVIGLIRQKTRYNPFTL